MFGFKLFRKIFLLVICLGEFAIISFLLTNGNTLPINKLLPGHVPPESKDAKRVAEQIVEACPRPQRSYSRLLVLPIVNDRDDILKTQVQKSFQKKIDVGWYAPAEETLLSKALETFHEYQPSNADKSEIIPKKNAIRLGQLVDAEFVLCGIVDKFTPTDESHDISCCFYLLDVGNGAIVFESTFSSQTPDVARAIGKMDMNQLFSRIGLVALVMLACPLILSPGFRLLAKLESGFISFACMVAISVAPICLAVRILEIPLPILLQIACYIAIFVVTAIWTALLMDRAAAKIP